MLAAERRSSASPRAETNPLAGRPAPPTLGAGAPRLARRLVGRRMLLGAARRLLLLLGGGGGGAQRWPVQQGGLHFAPDRRRERGGPRPPADLSACG